MSEKGVEMNTIQNYGMTNYQTNFQARSGKQAVKTLADLKRMTPIERKNYEANKLLNKIRGVVMKMECKCNCNGDAFMNEGIGLHETLRTMQEAPLGDYRTIYKKTF